jgi:hypothetical protein
MRRLLGIAVLVAVVALAAGCTEYRVERQGKDFGEAVCDLKNADSAEDAQAALENMQSELEDALEIVGRPVSEDIDDVENNLGDLANHVSDGQDALTEQDIAAIRRNAEEAAETASGSAQRFYQGVVQGLGDCSD